MRIPGWFYAIGAALLIALFFITQIRLGTDTRPNGDLSDLREVAKRDDVNVILLLVDTLRADRLGAYGYERPTSPSIDSLAATGIRFANHISQSSWTKASMASLWTGLNPVRAGITRYSHGLPPEAVMPAERLTERGFVTAGLWRNGWVAPNFGFSQGFELYQRPVPGHMPEVSRRENPAAKLSGSDEDNTRAAIEFLRVHGHERFFLYVHYMDAHQYLSDEKSALFGTSYSDLYDNSIHWTDRQIQRLLDTLDEKGIRDRTMIVLASDHGEAFGEHGTEGHAKNLYGEVIETPLIVSLPFRLHPGIVVDAQTHNIDIWPTILDLLGVEGLESPDGRSLVAAMLGNETPDAPGFSHLDQNWGHASRKGAPMIAVTEDSFRLTISPPRVRNPGKGKEKVRTELYHLGDDPGEKRDLKIKHPEVVNRMTERARAHLAEATAPWGTPPLEVEIDDLQMGQLRALGYALE